MHVPLQTFKEISLAVPLLIVMNHIWNNKYFFLVSPLATHMFKYSSVPCRQ